MECERMTKDIAAIMLVHMIAEMSAAGCDNPTYHEAVAVACAELMKAGVCEPENRAMEGGGIGG